MNIRAPPLPPLRAAGQLNWGPKFGSALLWSSLLWLFQASRRARLSGPPFGPSWSRSRRCVCGVADRAPSLQQINPLCPPRGHDGNWLGKILVWHNSIIRCGCLAPIGRSRARLFDAVGPGAGGAGATWWFAVWFQQNIRLAPFVLSPSRCVYVSRVFVERKLFVAQASLLRNNWQNYRSASSPLARSLGPGEGFVLSQTERKRQFEAYARAPPIVFALRKMGANGGDGRLTTMEF